LKAHKQQLKFGPRKLLPHPMQSTAGSTQSDVLVYNLTLQLVQLEQRFQQSEAAGGSATS
jgi:hypothetical protein